MTIEEILRRIVRGHLNTILLCGLVPLALVLLVELRDPPDYGAEVRLQTRSVAPGSSTEAEGLSSRVLAVATTPQVVQSALSKAELPASTKQALEAANHQVTVDRLGESPVVVLSFLDADADAARAAVSSLAAEVIAFLNNGGRDEFEAMLAEVRSRSADALARRDQLQADLLDTDGLQARANLEVLLEAAQQDLDHIREELTALTRDDVQRDLVVAIDAAQPTVERVPSAVVPRSALALLLGLLVGVTLAVVQETLKPRIAGVRELARALDAPVLGSVAEPWALTGSLSLAARRQGVETVVLVGVDERDERVVRHLLESMHPRREEELTDSASLHATHVFGSDEPSAAGSGAPPAGRPRVTISSEVRFTERYGVTPAEEPTAGLVVVSTGTARRTSLDRVQDMVRAVRWPVVGVVDASAHRWMAGRHGTRKGFRR